MKTIRLILCGICAALPQQILRAADALSQQDVIAVVLRENPSLKAVRAKWEMMKARAPQARAWEDLRLSADSVAGRFVDVPPESFMNQSVMLEQELPVSGKNLSRARAATAEAAAAFEELRRMELDVIWRAQAAYARLSNGYAQREVNRHSESLLNQFVQISSSRYETGAATQADVLLAQTDAAKLLEAGADIERQISEAQSALNVLMNRRAQAPLSQPAALAFKPRELSLEKLQAISIARRPELQRAQSRIDAEKFRLELANRQWIADPALNMKAQRYNEATQAVNEVDVGISIPLPWLNQKKYAAGVLEARKSVENAQREFDAARVETLGLVRDQIKKIQTSAAQYELYRDKILPLARQTVEASRAAYEASTGGFLQLITTRRTLQDVESTALNHLTNYETAVAELDAIVGNSNPILLQSAKDISK
jgi:outer membrane protein TolC